MTYFDLVELTCHQHRQIPGNVLFKIWHCNLLSIKAIGKGLYGISSTALWIFKVCLEYLTEKGNCELSGKLCYDWL